MITYIEVSAVEVGIDPDLAFYLVAIINAAGAFGRIFSGYLGDKFGRRFVGTRFLPIELPTPRCDDHARALHRSMWRHDNYLAFP